MKREVKKGPISLDDYYFKAQKIWGEDENKENLNLIIAAYVVAACEHTSFPKLPFAGR